MSTETTDRNFASSSDIDEFIVMVERFERGEVNAEQFRAFRLVRGVYGQRQDGVLARVRGWNDRAIEARVEPEMLRIKIPGGLLTPEQMTALGDVASKAPRKLGHVTTRQNVQFHFLQLAEVDGAMTRLAETGLTTRGACGNAVRNVTGCARAGLCSGEAFDTTPFQDAITRHFLRRPLAEALPRKFKIAFSGCPSDCAAGAINDIGFIAHRSPEGARRFRIVAAGGLSSLPTDAFLLHESYPAERIREVAETLLRLFDRTGNRENRGRARMKFVVKKLGVEGFVREYEKELALVLESKELGPLEIPDEQEVAMQWALPPVAGRGLAEFARYNVAKTRHVGRVFVTVNLPVGDLTAAQMYGLAGIMSRFGDHTARLSVSQNLLLRDVDARELPVLYRQLVELDLARPYAGTSADVGSCPGADSCKLAITSSRDLAHELTVQLAEKPLDGVSVKLSGCPNSCGQHQIATIGLQGGVRKINGRAAPHYIIVVGGGIDAGGASFGRVAGKVPARRANEAIERLLLLAERSRGEGETPEAWLRRADQAVLKEALLDLTELGDRATPEDFVDIGQTVPFRVVEMEGECAA